MVNEMLKTNKNAIAIKLVAIVTMATPASATMDHGGQSVSDKAEKMVEVAEKEGERIENLIAPVYVNQTALELIENATLFDDLEHNMTLFDEGTANVNAAYETFESGTSLR